MAEKLTEQQRAVVNDRGGRLLVSAAAGSGKTKVLVDRLLRYLTDPVDPANIDDFLIITYTKAAAAELRGKITARLTEMVAQNPGDLHLQRQLRRLYLTKISTVHAFCGDILREFAFALRLPGDFRIAEENECAELRTLVMEKLLSETYETEAEHPYFRALADTQGLGRDDRLLPQIVMKVYDSARCHLDPDAWLEHCLSLVQTQGLNDAAQSEYGSFLIERLHQWLDLQILALERCAERADAADGFEKSAQLLRDHVRQLRYLRNAQTWEQVRERKTIDFGRIVFPKKLTDPELKEVICAVRDACKEEIDTYTGPFADDSAWVLGDLYASADAVRGLIELTNTFAKAYDAAKQSRRMLDFSDLEHKTLDLLLGKNRTGATAAATEIAKRFREVMVDEYQDSNAVQDAIYGALTDGRKNLFMVGDIKQSIYQFRLADPSIFLEKYLSFRPAQQTQAGEDRKIVLGDNFRSSGGILEACNDVFHLCMTPDVGGLYYGEDEALHEGKKGNGVIEPEVWLHCIEAQSNGSAEEATFIAADIEKTIREGTIAEGETRRAVRPEDIAILLRSPGTVRDEFCQALEKRGIRTCTGGGVDLLKTEEIGTLYALLQVIYNPRLDIPLVAVLCSPVFGFSADELAQLRSRHTKCTFFDALRRGESDKCRAFVDMLARLRRAMAHFSLTELLERVLTETAFEEIYGAMENGAKRRANIRAFFSMAVDYEAGGNRDLGFFLEHLRTSEEKGLKTETDLTAAGCVTIMSIHKSKGLQFPIVYLCGLGKKFNFQDCSATVLCHKDMGLGLSAVDTRNRLRYPTLARSAISARMRQEIVSEEMRVLYVAMTRAQNRLVMCHTAQSLAKKMTKMVRRMDMSDRELLTREAQNAGQWVLFTALRKTEASALHALAGRPAETATGRYTWQISVDQAPPQETAHVAVTDAPTRIADETLEKIKNGLDFVYPYAAAIAAPSKLTATGLKGRYKDEEAAQQTIRKSLSRQWRAPSFVKPQHDGREYGNALHTVMQYIDYAACGDTQAVQGELVRLYAQGLISEEQMQSVKPSDIAAFFATPLGQKLRQGKVVREFKFSILQDAGMYDRALSGEEVLLQGVVDCALIEEDGITILDFKSDFVTEATFAEKCAQYAPQVHAYCAAMAQIYERPIKQKLLYFFHCGKFAEL